MRLFWQRFTAALTPGVRLLLTLFVAVGLIGFIGRQTHSFDVFNALILAGLDFWRGQFWRVISYVLVPTGIAGFIANSFALVALGSQLERAWRPGQFLLYCAICTVSAGFAKALLASGVRPPLAGLAPLTFGLLVGWAFIFGSNPVAFPVFGTLTTRQLVIALALVSFVMMLFSAGLTPAFISVSGGLIGWLYLWLAQKCLLARAPRVASSERISRLEL